MQKMMEELMKKKKASSGKMDPMKKKAKMGVLKEIAGMASDSMGDEIRDMKKVTVASDSEEGLKEGLEKAEDMMEAKMDASKESDDSEDSEESDVDSLKEHVESCEMTAEDADAMIKMLEAKKSKMY